MDYKMTFSPSKLREARKAIRHSQDSLSREIGASRGAIVAYENGTNIPGANALASIAWALGKSCDYFFEPLDQSSSQDINQTA